MRFRFLMCAMVVATLVGAGCGSDDDDDASTGESTPDAVVTTAAGADGVASGTAPTEATAPGSGSTPTSGSDAPPGDVEACPLLDGVDVSVLLGEPAGAPEPQGRVCVVAPADAESHGHFQLVVETDLAADNFENQREVFGVDGEVADLGDAAFHSGAYLFVLDGDVFFFLQAVRDAAIGSRLEQSDLEAAARTVQANLTGS